MTNRQCHAVVTRDTCSTVTPLVTLPSVTPLVTLPSVTLPKPSQAKPSKYLSVLKVDHHHPACNARGEQR